MLAYLPFIVVSELVVIIYLLFKLRHVENQSMKLKNVSDMIEEYMVYQIEGIDYLILLLDNQEDYYPELNMFS